MTDASRDRHLGGALGRLLSEADWRLSMRISPRAKRDADNQGLRGLLLHRFSDTNKAVARVGLRNHTISIYCEACDTWTRLDDFPLDYEYDCSCGRSYRAELVVFEEVE